jgi:aminoglycoside phosphotransferase (APT) family kinase protein
LADISYRASLYAPGDAVISAALERLHAAVPEDGSVVLCHGDINVFNYLFRNREVVGVVDWERARLGDWRSDLGQLLALGHLKGAPWCPAGAAPFAQGYAAISGRPVAGMAFFRARWLLDLAVIARAASALGHDDLWFSWEQVAKLLAESLREIG